MQDTFRILIITPQSQGRNPIMRYHVTPSNAIWETNDEMEATSMMRSLLNTNPIPILDLVKTVNWTVDVNIE